MWRGVTDTHVTQLAVAIRNCKQRLVLRYDVSDMWQDITDTHGNTACGGLKAF